LAQLRKLLDEHRRNTAGPRESPRKYQADPVGYAHDVLGVAWTPIQQEIAQALLTPPHRVFVTSANNVGKSNLAAGMVNWFFDHFDPGICITTAPEARGVTDTLWKEIRVQRRGRPGFIGDVAPVLRTSANHYAKGYTIRPGQGEGFQGRHDAKLFFVFEEACGLHETLWTTTRTMCKAELGHMWLVILNPVDTTSRAYFEEGLLDLQGKPYWQVFRISAFDHPNIAAQLRGESPPVPFAVTIEQIEDGLAAWCEPIPAEEATALDIEWRGRWYRPGPQAEARLRGRWPSQGTYGVWSDALWQAALRILLVPAPSECVPEIGCDVARFGDDFTAIHVRHGPVSLSHESGNGWPTTHTIGRLKQLARHLAEAHHCTPDKIPIKVDDDGVGGGVTDALREAGYFVIAVRAGTPANAADDYPNRRSELWFHTANLARQGQLSLARLSQDVQARLKKQLMAPVWKLDSDGRREVEKKEATKKKLGCSPDDADAFNLAYAPQSWFFPKQPETQPHGPPVNPYDRYRNKPSNAERRGVFGRSPQSRVR
jgi:hypothetical protein